MIEFDRKNSNDAVFYHCGNEEFIDFVTDVTGFKLAYGTYSDISTLMSASKLCAVNLSSGYYNAHTTLEYVNYAEMMDVIEVAKVLIKEKCDEPFKYMAKTYTNTAKNYSTMSCAKHGYEYYQNFLDNPPAHLYEDQGLADIARNDKDLELEVTFYGPSYSEEVIQAYGETKAECWMNLFLDNPNLRFNDIVDYTWG
jgi:hypothetical protein